jgi:hypothetical protein
MVQAANFGDLDDPARLGALDGPPIRRILLEREVSSRPVIVRDVARQDAVQVAFAQDEDVFLGGLARRLSPEVGSDRGGARAAPG